MLLRGHRLVLTADLDEDLHVTRPRPSSSSNTRKATVRFHRPSSVCTNYYGCARIQKKRWAGSTAS